MTIAQKLMLSGIAFISTQAFAMAFFPANPTLMRDDKKLSLEIKKFQFSKETSDIIPGINYSHVWIASEEAQQNFAKKYAKS